MWGVRTTVVNRSMRALDSTREPETRHERHGLQTVTGHPIVEGKRTKRGDRRTQRTLALRLHVKVDKCLKYPLWKKHNKDRISLGRLSQRPCREDKVQSPIDGREAIFAVLQQLLASLAFSEGDIKLKHKFRHHCSQLVQSELLSNAGPAVHAEGKKCLLLQYKIGPGRPSLWDECVRVYKSFGSFKRSVYGPYDV